MRMLEPIRLRSEPCKKLLAAALIVPLAFGLMHPAEMRAQVPQSAAPLHFNAASLKLSADQSILESRPKRTTGRFRWHTQLMYLLGYAWHMEWWRISDVPGGGTIYDLQATTDPDATEDQVRLMLQTLLIERFKMRVRMVTKDAVEGYSLTVVKGGPKMQEVKEEPASDDAAKSDSWVSATGPSRDAILITGHRAGMLQLSEQLQRLLSASVLDRTGLAGSYDFSLQFVRGGDSSDYSAVVGAVKQLGLKLEKFKGPVEFLVIDRMEKLGEN